LVSPVSLDLIESVLLDLLRVGGALHLADQFILEPGEVVRHRYGCFDFSAIFKSSPIIIICVRIHFVVSLNASVGLEVTLAYSFELMKP
jgi:hypothetical protein